MTRFEAQIRNSSQMGPRPKNKNKHSSPDKIRRLHQRFRSFDLNDGIPEFDSKIQDEAFYDWLNTVEEIFEYYDTPNHRKVKLAVVELK